MRANWDTTAIRLTDYLALPSPTIIFSINITPVVSMTALFYEY